MYIYLNSKCKGTITEYVGCSFFINVHRATRSVVDMEKPRSRRVGKRGIIRRRNLLKIAINNMATIGILLLQMAIVFAIGFLLVSAFAERTINIGGAMYPTVEHEDIVLINSLVYNAIQPRRGDVITFRPRGNENAHLAVRRVVGLPGETLQIIDGKININGDDITVKGLNETPIVYYGLAEEPLTLGANEFFVMGDNHLNSSDSRMAEVGIVRRDNIYGRAWFSIGNQSGLVR